MRAWSICAAVTLSVMAIACGSSSDSGSPDGGGGSGAGRPADAKVVEDATGRSYLVDVPPDYDAAKPAPLLIEIHGFSSWDGTGPGPNETMEDEHHIVPAAMKRGVFVAHPLGTHDTLFNKYVWNATDACCGWNVPEANDIGFIHAMMTDLEKKYAIDPKRIFIFGHSNGGFMTNRLACDSAGRFAGAVSLAGMPFKDHARCKPSSPIAYAHVHGNADGLVLFDGGPPYGIAAIPPAPGAEEAFAIWKANNRCGGADTAGDAMDLVTDLAGAETTRTVASGCEGNGATEFWKIEKGVHSPNFGAAWPDAVLDFLLAHPKP